MSSQERRRSISKIRFVGMLEIKITNNLRLKNGCNINRGRKKYQI